MSFVLFSAVERVAIIAGAVGFAGLATALGRRGSRVAVPLALAAAVLAGLALCELAVALALDAAGPDVSAFNEHRWVLLSPWGRGGLILGVLGAVSAVVLGWRTSASARTPLERAVLVSLRAAAAAAALTLFLQPAVELRQVAREPNHVAVLIDDSASMSLAEVPDGPRRIDRALGVLERSRPTLDAWRARHRIELFRFSEALVPATLDTLVDEPPRGAATRMYQALDQVRSRYDGGDLAGVVLFSDGVATDGFAEGVGEGGMSDFLGSLEVPVHTVWSGRPGLRDVAVARVLADEFAFARTVVRIEAIIHATGYDKRRVRVTLSSDGKPLRQKWVDVGPELGEVPVVFEITPPRVGKYVYEISTPVADDEAVAENNRRTFVMRVIRDKIRVLQVAGAPSWDVHALRRMLKKNPNVDLISFFILRTQEDIGLVPNSEMSLIPFPTQELFQHELPSFDLIVLQNFEFEPYGISAYLENIRSYVEGGGGLVMLGGAQSFSSGGYAGTPVGATLPVELWPRGAVVTPRRERRRGRSGGRDDGAAGAELGDGLGGGLIDVAEFVPTLTRAGKLHPITALRYEVEDNLATWRALPPLEGVNLVARARPDAVVLAVHPELRDQDGEPMPVITAGEYRDGRVLAVTTDSLWRWGFRAAARAGDDGRYYTKLWENAIRWLIHDPELLHLHVESDDITYAPGSSARIDVRLLDLEYTPLAGGKVALSIRRGSDAADTELVHSEEIEVGDAGTGRIELDDLSPGVYRVLAEADVGGRPVSASDIFLVTEAGVEFEQPAAREELLATIAARTGGTYLGPAEALPAELALAPPRIVRVDRRADVELWSRPLLLFLALIFLGVEWGLRQRSGSL
ncbi:MAG: hypothetical protein Tsb0020_31100 [Haliangiales bacterium]